MAEEVSTPRRSRRGFAGIDPEIAEQSRLKSLETRKANAEMRNNRLEAAKKLRDQVTELRKEIEVLEQKADELDGEITANKNRRKYEAQLTADLEELIGGVVSPQYLKQTIAHAIRTGLSADQVITPRLQWIYYMIQMSPVRNDLMQLNYYQHLRVASLLPRKLI